MKLERHSKVLTWGVLLILLGSVMKLAQLYCALTFHPTNTHFLVLLRFLGHAGMTLFSLGFIGVMVNLPDWQKYFQSRLAETIQEREFLKTLSKGELISLQTDTLKAYFGSDEIDRNGSFLEFFHAKIQDFIGSPFREDARGIVHIAWADETHNDLIIEDDISYTCRQVNGRIQDYVQWHADDSEVLSLDDYSIRVEIPHDVDVPATLLKRYPSSAERSHTFRPDDTNNSLKKLEPGYGHKLELDEFLAIDRLRISIHAKYRVSKTRYQTWVMTHPSKRVSLVINHPSDMFLRADPIGANPRGFDIVQKPGLYTVTHDSWFMPYSGFAYQCEENPHGPEGQQNDGEGLGIAGAPPSPSS